MDSHCQCCRSSSHVTLTLKPAAFIKELELLKDRVAFADDSGLAPPSLFSHRARHPDRLVVGGDVGGRFVRVSERGEVKKVGGCKVSRQRRFFQI
jgi:hypothetical protein